METLFSELPVAARFFIAFLVVLLLIVLTFWLIRRFGGIGLGASAARGRQPRLAVIDAAPVDGRRRLVLIRRDNVEHLLMIGGPSDIVVEQNIVRAVPVASARDLYPARVPGGLAEAMARAEEPEREMPPPPVEPVFRESPPPRPAEPVHPTPPRLVRAAEPSGRTLPPAERLGRVPGEGEMPLRAAPPIMPAASAAPQAQKPAPEPAASAESRPPPANDAALTDMAQRLEAALRRPMAGPQAPQPPQTRTEPPKAEPAAPPRPAAPFGAPPAQPAKPAPRPEHAPEPARPAAMEQKPASGKSMLDSLEQEMASLLGRPIGKE